MKVLIFYNGIHVEAIRYSRKLDALRCLFDLLDEKGLYCNMWWRQKELYDQVKNNNSMYALVQFMRLRRHDRGETWRFIDTIKAKRYEGKV